MLESAQNWSPNGITLNELINLKIEFVFYSQSLVQGNLPSFDDNHVVIQKKPIDRPSVEDTVFKQGVLGEYLKP